MSGDVMRVGGSTPVTRIELDTCELQARETIAITDRGERRDVMDGNFIHCPPGHLHL